MCANELVCVYLSFCTHSPVECAECIALNVWNIINFSGVLGVLGRVVHLEVNHVYTSPLATHTRMHKHTNPPSLSLTHTHTLTQTLAPVSLETKCSLELVSLKPFQALIQVKDLQFVSSRFYCKPCANYDCGQYANNEGKKPYKNIILPRVQYRYFLNILCCICFSNDVFIKSMLQHPLNHSLND